MHKSLLFVLLLLAPVARAFAQADLKQQIADTLNAIANRDIWAGNVTVRGLHFNHRAKSATVVASSNLGYLPFRPETVDELYAAIRAQLPPAYRHYKLTCRVDRDNIDQLVCIEGMITRVGDLIPDIRIATFVCSSCKHQVEVQRIGNRIDQPSRCEHCHGQNTMQLDPNSCIFNDKQIVKMQEVPDQVPQGETPQSVTMFASEEMFDCVKPGDKVEVTGIYRAFPLRISASRSTVRDVFSTFIDVLHYRRKTDERYSVDEDDSNETQHVEEERRREEARLIELSRDEKIYEKLTASIAPSIWYQ